MTRLEVDTPPLSDVMGRAIYRFRVMAAGVAFWAAIALPFVYIPLMLMGLNNPSRKEAFLVLVLVHICSLVLGHRYPQL